MPRKIDLTRPERHYDAKVATAEGWTLCASSGALCLEALPGRGFASDEDAWEHVTAKAWSGSPVHKKALDLIEQHSPEAFARMGIVELRDAASSYRRVEKERFNAVLLSIHDRIAADPVLKSGAEALYADIGIELHQRIVECGAVVKDFEAHHERMVMREALLIALHDTQDLEHAGTLVRRRMLLTATPHDFFGQMVPQPDLEEQPQPL